MPPINLDAEYVKEYPPLPAERLQFEFMGKQLMRLPEVPIAAFAIIEQYPADFMPLLRALRSCINPAYHEQFDSLVPPPDQIEGYANGTVEPHPDDNYLTVRSAMFLWRWLVREGGGRPTQPASDSSDGRETTGTSSTDGLSTPAGWGLPGSAVEASPTSPSPTSPQTASSAP